MTVDLKYSKENVGLTKYSLFTMLLMQNKLNVYF